MVNAMAPKAPMGARRIRILITPNTACVRAREQIDDHLRALAHDGQRESEQDGEQQHLQDVAFREGIDHRVRDDVHQEIGHALRFGLAGVIGHGFRIERGGIDVESAAWLHHVPNDQADQQRDGGNHFKIEQRFAAHAAHLLHVLHPGDAGDHGAEDHQRDDHGDQADECVAQRLHGDRFCRADIAQSDSDHDREQHLRREAFVDRPSLDLRAYLRCCGRHELRATQNIIFKPSWIARGPPDPSTALELTTSGVEGWKPKPAPPVPLGSVTPLLESAGSAFRIGNVRMVEYVEEFGAELSGDAFPKAEGLGDRRIHVVVRHAAENIIPGGAIAAIRRRYQDRLTIGVATEVGERCHGQRSHGRGLGRDKSGCWCPR